MSDKARGLPVWTVSLGSDAHHYKQQRREMELRLEIEECELGAGWVEAYYLENDISRFMAIQEGIPDTRVRLYELAAHGLGHIPMSEQLRLGKPYKDTDFILFVPRNHSEANALLVRAVSKVLQEMEPGWISAVEKARESTDDPDIIAFWSRVPIEAVLAYLQNWCSDSS